MVAMVALREISLFLLVLVLAACDRFYGPKFRNEFDTSITVTIRRGDGAVSSGDWPPCFEAFVGKSDKPGDVIQEVKISKQGEMLYDLDAKEVERLLEQEEAHKGYSAWRIGSDGIEMVTNPDSAKCSKGKPME